MISNQICCKPHNHYLNNNPNDPSRDSDIFQVIISNLNQKEMVSVKSVSKEWGARITTKILNCEVPKLRSYMNSLVAYLNHDEKSVLLDIFALSKFSRSTDLLDYRAKLLDLRAHTIALLMTMPDLHYLEKILLLNEEKPVLFNKTLRLTQLYQNIEKCYDKNKICIEFAELGCFNEAIDLAITSSCKKSKNRILLSIYIMLAEHLLEDGRLDEASNLIQSPVVIELEKKAIKYDRGLFPIYILVIQRLLEEKKFNEAINLLKSPFIRELDSTSCKEIGSPDEIRAHIRSKISIHLCKDKQFNRAIGFAYYTIQDVTIKSKTLQEISAQLCKATAFNQAERVAYFIKIVRIRHAALRNICDERVKYHRNLLT